MEWVLLIYTLPSAPTRKRAFIWRELKKVGAVYLRDGVCVLPDRPDTRQALQAVAARVREFEGQATVVDTARLDGQTVQGVLVQAGTARQVEYTAVADAGHEFLAHVRREIRQRNFTEQELEILKGDLAKLRRWCDQIRGRDYFVADTAEVQAVLAECQESLAGLLGQKRVPSEVAQ